MDIVGIGALNVDFIASRRSLARGKQSFISELNSKFEHGTERPATELEVTEITTKMSSVFDVHLGGSAFNVIQALNSLNTDFELGFCGVEGNHPSQDMSFSQWFKRNNINPFVFEETDSIPGTCISYVQDGERSLITYPGVNKKFGNYIENHFESVVEYLSRFKIVHITSLFDDESPVQLLAVLSKLKKTHPQIIISYDPGHHWTKVVNPQIDAIYDLADYVFLNHKEFNLLGDYRFGDTDSDVASRIFDAYTSSSTVVILLKRYDAIRIYFKLQNKLMTLIHDNPSIANDDIEDATGAGDVFAAGFLVSELTPGMELRDGVELGLQLVRAKLTSTGTTEYNSFSNIYHSSIGTIVKRYGAVVEQIINNENSNELKPSATNEGIIHSPDFTMISVHGKKYTFTTHQAPIIKVLWMAYESGTPELHQKYLLESAGSTSDRMTVAFQSCDAFKKIIVSGSKRGTFMLNFDYENNTK